MAELSSRQRYVRFDRYEADLQTGILFRRGMKIRLRAQSFAVLASLLKRPGELVTREELRAQLWPEDVFVDFDNLLNTAVARLRAALGDSAKRPRFVECLPRRGYRFIGSIYEIPPVPAQPTEARVRTVVLPFVNLSGDPAQDCVSDGLTDEVITSLASLAPARLAVIARTTAMLYKGSRKDVARIGRELGVDYVVEGALRHDGARVAINVQLIQAGDQTQLFASKYDAPLRDIFTIHGAIAEAVATHIPRVADTVRAGASGTVRNGRKPTEDLVSYGEYVQGRNLLDRIGGVEILNAARQHLEKAVARDPEFAHAHDALAEVYWYLGYLGFLPPRQAFTTGMVYALRAIEIDNMRAETHALLGQFHKISEYNWSEVRREMDIALRLDPESPLVRMRNAVSGLMPHGRVRDAAEELEQALKLDPHSLLIRFWLSIMLLLMHDFERAIGEGRKILDLDPNYGLAYFSIAVGCNYQKRFEEALAAQTRAVELLSSPSVMLGWLALMLSSSGRVPDARNVLRRLHKTAKEKYVSPCSFAWTYISLGEIDDAFKWMNRAVEECDQIMMPIKSYRFLDPLRADPRFGELLRKMNLEA